MSSYSIYLVYSTTSLAAGASVTLTANGGPGGGNGTWTAPSSDYTVQAYVDDVNRITETNEKNNTLSKTLSTTVTFPVTGVSVSPTAATIAVGGTQQLTAMVSPSDATNKSVTWSSSSTSVATVNTSGLVTAVAPGTAIITVTTVDQGKTASSAITVTGTVGPPDLIVTDITQTVSGSTVRFSAVVRNQGTGATPSGTIIGVAFIVSGSVKSWSDTYTTSLPAGSSVTLTANGGPGGGNGTWTAPSTSYSVQAFVDDVNRITESNENNNTFSKNFSTTGTAQTGTARYGGEEVEVENASVFTLYPNPAKNHIEITHYAEHAGEIRISIGNELAQSLEKKFKVEKGSNKLELDVSTLNVGLHYLKLNSGRQIVVKKLIIIR